MFSFEWLRGIALPFSKGTTCMLFSCVYFGKANVYYMIMLCRRGTVFVNILKDKSQ